MVSNLKFMNNKVGGIKFKSTSRYLLVLGLLVGSLGYTSSAIADNKAVSIYVDGRVQTISTSKNVSVITTFMSSNRLTP